MARFVCVRCGTEYHSTEGEHLCKDLRKRLERRLKQKAIILEAITTVAPWRKNEDINNRTADEILKGIVGMLAEDD
jgi:hypothetical protein